MMNTINTPRVTYHARQRCAELGISTKRAKRIVQQRTSTYPSPQGHSNNGVVCSSTVDPEYAVVWDEHTNTILTVLPRTTDRYKRTERGWEPLS